MDKKQSSNMWGGRFETATADLVLEYTESVSYDYRLYRQDIAGSKAHARMLAKQGILTDAEAQDLCRGLDQVLEEIESGKFVWDRKLEDVHMNVESRLTEILGDVGKKLHTGRSRNDQVALDFRLFVSERTGEWRNLLFNLIETLATRADEHKNTLMPGYTHLQPAQPIILGHHLMAYAAMFRRDAERLADCDKRTRISPLGAAALAGTTYASDPAFVAEELSMYGIFTNSMDAVSDRDFVLESLFAASTMMLHLSRFCEDIILWANPAFGFIRLPDDYSTGSSIMPQKRNPDVAELMRGKTGRVFGALTGLLATMKGLPMTYNRDLQEDKEHFFDVDRTVTLSLKSMAGMIGKLAFVPERMTAALKRGFLNATELADYLVGRGIPFRQAHHYTGTIVAKAESKQITLEEMALEDFKEVCPAIDVDIYEFISYETAVKRRNGAGGTGPASVSRQISDTGEWLKRERKIR